MPTRTSDTSNPRQHRRTVQFEAGPPGEALDNITQALDLNALCIKRPAATFFVRVQGDSMVEAGIFDNDILVVDRSVRAEHGDVVIAIVDGAFTVKELALRPTVQLLPRNADYRPVAIPEGAELELFGVVTSVIRQLRRRQQHPERLP